jgi:hypothetical protein
MISMCSGLSEQRPHCHVSPICLEAARTIAHPEAISFHGQQHRVATAPTPGPVPSLHGACHC